MSEAPLTIPPAPSDTLSDMLSDTLSDTPMRVPLRVAVFVTNAAGVYGGGRLAAYLLAQCLARAGAAVSFVTNVRPVFHEELQHFGHPSEVALHLTRDFHTGLPAGDFDIVVLIPGQSQDRTFYMGARGFARRRGARLVLFNFETPNWFNSLAPQARTEDLWLEWRRCIQDASLVLSNSEQSMRFARRYYCSHPDTTRFAFWHQPVNVQALARVQPQFRENRVVCFVRARDPHKGGQDLIDALSDDLRGWTLSLIVGSARLDDDYREAIQAAARPHGIHIEVRPLLSDTDKFVELRRARMLLYPSHFEGYGIPPIEALAAATPCVCYDLPVFREVCGDALLAAPVGDIAALQHNIRRVIASSPNDWSHLPQHVASVASILHCGENALHTLQTYRDEAGERPSPPPPPTCASVTAPVATGGLAFHHEADSAFVTGWIAAKAPVLAVSAGIGARGVWTQGEIPLASLLLSAPPPPASPGHPGAQGFALHLDRSDLAALAAAEDTLRIAVETGAGVAVLPLRPAWAPCPPGRAEFPLPVPPGSAPGAAPPRAEIQRATCDEYGVVEVEGWVLATPRIEAIRVWVDDRFLGETVPDRASLGAHERLRHHGDAFGGFHFAGRRHGLPLQGAPYRLEFCHGDAVVLALGGHTAPFRRVSRTPSAAALGCDAALLPPGFLEDERRGALAVLVLEDDRALAPVAGAALRALLAHLRAPFHTARHDIILLLHGNPHRFADDLPRWRALADGILLVNPLTPAQASALPAVLAALAGAAPRLRVAIADRPGLATALAPLSASGVARLVLPTGNAPFPPDDDPPTALLLEPDDLPPPGIPTLRIGFDTAGLASALRASAKSPSPEPASAIGLRAIPPRPEEPLLAIDATRNPPPARLRDILEAAGPAAAARGWRLALVVDAPPLSAEAPIRQALSAGEAVALVWPAGLAGTGTKAGNGNGTVRGLIQPLGAEPAGAVTAAALENRIPVLLWSVMTPSAARPGPLAGILPGRHVVTAPSGADAYEALDALLLAPTVKARGPGFHPPDRDGTEAAATAPPPR